MMMKSNTEFATPRFHIIQYQIGFRFLCLASRFKFNYNKTTMPPIEVIANCELCMTKYGVNRLIGSKDIAKTNI